MFKLWLDLMEDPKQQYLYSMLVLVYVSSLYVLSNPNYERKPFYVYAKNFWTAQVIVTLISFNLHLQHHLYLLAYIYSVHITDFSMKHNCLSIFISSAFIL